MDNEIKKKNYAVAFVLIVTLLIFAVGVPIGVYLLFKISDVLGAIAFIFVIAILYSICNDGVEK